MKYLDGEAMRLALKNGVQRVIASQEGLNKINVFPVADGDTGTNMALTVGAMGQVLQVDDKQPLHKLLARSADALLDGARGNSGAILAQFFQGLSDTAAEWTRFTTDNFASAVKAGSAYARDALSEPREGTILSVIDAFADSLGRHAKIAGIDFPTLLGEGLSAAEKALVLTKTQLAELKKADVVDAGAKGFVAMLQGILAYVRDGETIDRIDIPDDVADVSMAGEEVDLEFRFCTECIINGEDIDRRKLREELSQLGGSLVLAGSRYKAKIHIHVNEPDAVFRLARCYGEVSGEKADDMHRQQHTTHGNSPRVAIITDSAADIADADMDALDIHFVPLRIQFGEQGYMDKLSISEREFFELLRTDSHHPTTSQPSPGDYRRQYQFLASHHKEVLAISLSSQVSGTYSAAKAAAQRVSGPGNIHVLDSRNATLGQGLIVREAAELAMAGESLETIRERVEHAIDNTVTFALVSDLTYAVRGGRVPKSRKLIADLLRIRPVLRTSPEGKAVADGGILGFGNRVEKFVRYITKRVDTHRPVRIGIGHAASVDDSIELEKQLKAALPHCIDSYRTDCCAAFGVHGGPGLIVASLLFH